MPSQRRLKTQDDCRRAIAWIFTELSTDRMKPDKARVLIYAALSCSSILTDHELEDRIQRLETLQHQGHRIRKMPA
jgi:hypothetical protein